MGGVGAEVREDQSGAVELHARQVPSEYRRNAREKDQQYGPAGSTLIQDRVASFGACRAVVFGNYGEASRDVHTLIHVAAQRLATKHWRLLGARARRRLLADTTRTSSRFSRDLSAIASGW